MSIYPILAWFNGSWHGSTVQFTAFFLFEKKKKRAGKAGFSIQGIAADMANGRMAERIRRPKTKNQKKKPDACKQHRQHQYQSSIIRE